MSEDIVKFSHRIKHFYMLSRGTIKLFDEKYNYMYDLEPGSYFGEYQIMFGLYSNITYRSAYIKHDAGEIFNYCNIQRIVYFIPSEKFMSIITEDPLAYRHFHSIALQRYRYNKKMIEILADQRIAVNLRNEL